MVLRDYDEARPAILGGLLNLLSAALRELPEVELDVLPRMADYARILAALDPSHRLVYAACIPRRHPTPALAAGVDADAVALAVREPTRRSWHLAGDRQRAPRNPRRTPRPEKAAAPLADDAATPRQASSAGCSLASMCGLLDRR